MPRENSTLRFHARIAALGGIMLAASLGGASAQSNPMDRDIDKILIDDNSVAVLARLSGVKHDGRAICFRLSHFVEFRDGRIVTLTSIIDSFNAVEQITGQTIDLGATPTLVPDNDLVSV